MTGSSFYPTRFASAVVLALVLGACATTKPPVAQVSATRQAIQQAEQANARELAPVEFRAAQRKLEAAEAAMNRRKHREAERLAHQALVDAQLAHAVARSARAEQAARELEESNRTLREELERAGDRRQ